MHTIKQNGECKMSEFDQELLNAGLNRSQRKFCKLPASKNIRLLAPAGSGKTYSLLWRCLCIHNELANVGKPSPRFIIVTFTRSAKYELEDRIKNDTRFSELRISVWTLNGWGWDQLKQKRAGCKLAALKKDRKDLVTHDLLALCKKYGSLAPCVHTVKSQNRYSEVIIDMIDLLKALGFTHLMGKREYRSHVKCLEKIGLYPLLQEGYERLLVAEDRSNSLQKEKDFAIDEFFDFWKRAVKQLEENNRYTLEDQKYWPRIFLETQINAGKYPQGAGRFDYLMIDEFQDINPLDLALVKAISLFHGQGKPNRITIVGDDDQAIFGWRGTTPEYILHPDDFFGVKFETVVLNTNYRSPKAIVDISSKLISYNKERVVKEMKSAAPGKAIIKIVTKKKTISTIDSTLQLVEKLSERDDYSSIALISRKQTSLFPYQVLLSAKNIPYHVAADIDIFDGEAMSALQRIIQIVYRAKTRDNDDPIEDLLEIINKLDRYQLQNKDRSELITFLNQNNPETLQDALDVLRGYSEPIKKQTPEDICDLVEQLLGAETVYDFMMMVNKNLVGLGKDYTKAELDNHYKEPQFFRLTEISAKYGSDFRQFYRDIEKARKNSVNSRNRENDNTANGYHENSKYKIHLNTATRSKGHEYDACIILDVDDNEWPNRLSGNIEEERRLFYVAMTRARKALYFSVSGEMLESRFLLEAGLI